MLTEQEKKVITKMTLSTLGILTEQQIDAIREDDVLARQKIAEYKANRLISIAYEIDAANANLAYLQAEQQLLSEV